MEYKGHLIPLRTHTVQNKRGYSVYEVDEMGDIQKEKSIDGYFIAICGDEVTLTRVVSDEEVKKWNSEESDLGSTNQLYWEIPTVHTAYHSITDEFVHNSSYNKVIKYVITRDELNQAFRDGSASIGTYDRQFRSREKDSILPFDIEIVFDDDRGFELLRTGYQRWKERTGTESIENPF
ncbi:hypothetical protein HYX12_00345 [Candidatus Woesearchaeota archaeon]|nr:hypothetical protein [Candidatus Woesearchaeota archaeon]